MSDGNYASHSGSVILRRVYRHQNLGDYNDLFFRTALGAICKGHLQRW